LRFQSYGEAKPSGENFIDCELLAKVKHLHFQMNLFLPYWALAAKRQPQKVSECAAERTPNIFFTKLIGRRCLRRFGARWSQTLI
jgi:hypothetical protein